MIFLRSFWRIWFFIIILLIFENDKATAGKQPNVLFIAVDDLNNDFIQSSFVTYIIIFLVLFFNISITVLCRPKSISAKSVLLLIKYTTSFA